MWLWPLASRSLKCNFRITYEHIDLFAALQMNSENTIIDSNRPANLSTAEAFIDAFYSFDWVFTLTPSSRAFDVNGAIGYELPVTRGELIWTAANF
jgi:hypothetical protein